MSVKSSEETGAVSNRRVFTKTTELGGSPGGCTVARNLLRFAPSQIMQRRQI